MKRAIHADRFDEFQAVLRAVDAGLTAPRAIAAAAQMSESCARRRVAWLRRGGYLDSTPGEPLDITALGRNVMLPEASGRGAPRRNVGDRPPSP